MSDIIVAKHAREVLGELGLLTSISNTAASSRDELEIVFAVPTPRRSTG